MKVALVYDRVNKFGGAERVLLALHEIWPKAPLFTSVYDSKGASWAKDFKVISSGIQNVPLAKSHHEIYPWLMPFAFESFDFDGFDVVISVTSAEAKGIITKPKTMHLCYCLTPTRYLWSNYKHYLNNPRYGSLNPFIKIFIKSILKNLKKWDLVASQRPDYYLAISKTVKERIKKYYQREAEVIYPPIDTDKFKPFINHPATSNQQPASSNHYFLVVSRLVSYKRVDLIVGAFNKLGRPLKIIGQGRERKRLGRIARKNIEFLDKGLTDEELVSYYQKCLALVFSGEEDFGLVSLEAQACGKPVIAFKGGGVGETVVAGKTGVLFYPQTVEALTRVIRDFDVQKFEPEDGVENAQKYAKKIFLTKFKQKVEEKWREFQKIR